MITLLLALQEPLVVTGGVGIGDDLNMGGNLNVDGSAAVGSDTDSSSNTTGALIVDGGLGLGKNLNMVGALMLMVLPQ